MIVTVNKLNRRNAPVNNTADKSNITGTVSKGFSFNSVAQMTTPSGTWYKDSGGFYYWGGGVSQLTSTTQPQPMPSQTPTPTSGGATNFSLRQIQLATGASQKHAQIFMPHINATCVKYAINTPARALCFFAQIGEESAGLLYTEEIASGANYQGRMGNLQPGDGIRFKGRGLIQITGRENYGAVSRDFGIDFLSDPSLLGAKNADECSDEQLKYAALGAGWYWNSRKLNVIADRINLRVPIENEPNNENFITITKAINGGINGLQERLLNYKNGLQAFL
jgi:putative chitinase